MKKVGLYFGSFNPIHFGHLMVANYAIEHFKLDEIHLIVSPLNPFKQQKDLLNIEDRLKIAALATCDNKKILVNAIETKLPLPSITSNTLKAISETTKDCEFYIVMGIDNFLSLHKWTDVETILKYNIIVFPRVKDEKETNIENQFNEQLSFLNEKFNINGNIQYAKNAIINTLSSTFIRNEIKSGNSIQYLVPSNVQKIIIDKKFYKN